MRTLHIRGLGAFDVTADGGPPVALNPRAKLLLFYLVLHRSAPQARQHVAFVFFPDSSEPQARANLRGLIRELRKALPEVDQLVDTDGQTIQWRADASCLPDVSAFEDALAQAGHARSAGDSAAERAALEGAASLYKGELLPGRYEDWVLVERERLQESYSDVLRRLALRSEAERDFRAAIGYAERWRRLDDLREEPYRLLLRLHAWTGDRGAVARVWEQCAAKLRAGLDVEPSAETRRTFEQYRNFEPPAPAATAPAQPAAPAAEVLSPRSEAAQPQSAAPPQLEAHRTAPQLDPPTAPEMPDPPSAPDPRLRYAKDALNYGVPAAGLAVSVIWLHAQVLVALPLSVLAFLGLYFILNPRSASEEARARLRDDVRAKLADCVLDLRRIRALLPAVRKKAVREQCERIAGLADGIVRKYMQAESTSLSSATTLELFLSLILKLLDWYARNGDAAQTGGRSDLQKLAAEIEQVLAVIEDSLKKLAQRADQSDLIELDATIQLLKSLLKMEGL